MAKGFTVTIEIDGFPRRRTVKTRTEAQKIADWLVSWFQYQNFRVSIYDSKANSTVVIHDSSN